MPLYDYECQACGELWEQEQPIREEPVRKCPKCGKESVRRLIGRTGFVLNGSGWSRDGYKG